MRVGILTFHHTYNYGASLQAFALQTYLELLGHEVFVINYLNDKMYDEFRFSVFSKKHSVRYNLLKLYNLPSQWRKRKRFEAFDRRYLHITERRLRTSDELSEVLRDFDRIIVGSDQVMNLVGTGFDYNYYLDFDIPSYKKATYAPSFGLQNLEEDVKNKMAKLLSDIKYLNAREENGTELIKELTGRDVPLVCDPTFLLKKEQWERYAILHKIKKPYVLIYCFNSYPAIEKAAMEKAKEVGGVVIDIHRFIPKYKKGYRLKRDIGPLEMIGLLLGASYVFTNSFHGAAISLNFNKNVIIFKHPIDEFKGQFNSNLRLITLSRALEIEDRLVSLNETPSLSEIDYTVVNKHLEAWRSESIKEIQKIFEFNEIK